MKIYKIDNLNKIYNSDDKCVALGLFDGVHIGHQKLIKQLIDDSQESNQIPTIITMENNFNKQGDLLIALKDRIDKFKQLGVKVVYVLQMNENNINKSKEEFISFLKVNNFLKVYVGEDFKFGKNAQGNINDLKESFPIFILQDYLYNNQRVSTSYIKELIKDNNFNQIKSILGEEFYIKGQVVHGKKLGRTIGIPTANLEVFNDNIKTGVYATITVLDNQKYTSITNVGINPTVGGTTHKVEVHILGSFNKDIYDKEIKVIFKYKIREEKKFSSVEDLKNQIEKDIRQIKEK